MNKIIDALKSTTFAGKNFTRNQLTKIVDTVNTFPHLSRKELGNTICENQNWVTHRGTYKINTCLKALEEMESMGIIKLPVKLEKAKITQKKIEWTDKTKEQAKISGSLDEIMPINIQLVTEKEDVALWNEFVDRYHYLKYRRPIGNYLRYCNHSVPPLYSQKRRGFYRKLNCCGDRWAQITFTTFGNGFG